MNHSIIYQDHEINFTVKVNQLAKRIILRISQEGVVNVTVPRKGFEKEAIQLVQKKAPWILANLHKLDRELESKPKVVDEIQFLGNLYPVEIVPGSKRAKLKFKTNKFELGLGELLLVPENKILVSLIPCKIRKTSLLVLATRT